MEPLSYRRISLCAPGRTRAPTCTRIRCERGFLPLAQARRCSTEARVQHQPQGHSLSSAPKPRRLCFPQEYEAPGCRRHSHLRGWLSLTRIGYEHADRLRTSGYLNNLSRCMVPIRMRGSYPDARTGLSTGRPSTTGCIHRPPSSAFLAADDGTRLRL